MKRISDTFRDLFPNSRINHEHSCESSVQDSRCLTLGANSWVAHWFYFKHHHLVRIDSVHPSLSFFPSLLPADLQRFPPEHDHLFISQRDTLSIPHIVSHPLSVLLSLSTLFFSLLLFSARPLLNSLFLPCSSSLFLFFHSSTTTVTPCNPAAHTQTDMHNSCSADTLSQVCVCVCQ